MKKAIKVLLAVIAGVAVAVSFLLISGTLVLDYSAEYNGERIHWNGAVYVPCAGEFTEGRTIAKTSDGTWRLDSVAEDDSHTFVVLRSFLDEYLYVREDYVVPKSGEITAVVWNGKKINDAEMCKSIAEIYKNNDWETFDYETEAIFFMTETQQMKELYLCYETCPVGTSFIGYLGKVNGKWVITIDISNDTSNKNGSPKMYQVVCKEIPNNYIPVLEKYFNQ